MKKVGNLEERVGRLERGEVQPPNARLTKTMRPGMSPLAICALLEYYFLAWPTEQGEYTGNLEAIRQLRSATLIQLSADGGYELTNRGRQKVDELRSVQP